MTSAMLPVTLPDYRMNKMTCQAFTGWGVNFFGSIDAIKNKGILNACTLPDHQGGQKARKPITNLPIYRFPAYPG